jgi:CobQ-like glutamine amidotransferase family enzyme
MVTHAGRDRLVGNVMLSTRWGDVSGFENHAGRTYLGAGAEPLGIVVNGHGNNGQDRTEGQIRGRAIGSYLHGALLPRNPALADWLLGEGLRRRAPGAELPALPDAWEHAAQQASEGLQRR